MFRDAWAFEQQRDELLQQDPNEEEFFTGEEEDETVFGRTDALVRECIQNSLDAGTGGVVTVRFSFRRCSSPPDAISATYLADLSPHLRACEQAVPPPTDPIPILVIEDSGTRGLCGDPGLRREPVREDAELQDWYWFWWRVGKSSKSGRDRGRWGLGRSVFAATSRIRTFFGLTLRATDSRLLLMGQSKLKTHSIDDERFVPHGVFRTTPPGGRLQMPFVDPSEVAAFERDFGTNRRQLGSGLTLVIPHPFDNLKPHAVARSVATHWFLPILKGQLRVEVQGPDARWVLAQDTIVAEVARLRWDEKPKRRPPPLDLAASLLSLQSQNAVPGLPLVGERLVPSWPDVVFPPELERDLKAAYDRDEPVAVRINMTVERANGERVPTWFDVALRRDADIDRGVDCFIRQGMTISKMSVLGPHRNHSGLVVVEDQELSALLGDTEGPAHEEWRTGESRPDRNFAHWKRRVPFVKAALPALIRRLTTPTDEILEDLLIDVFSIQGGTSDAAAVGGRGASRKRRPPPTPEPRAHTPKPYSVEATSNGFRVSGVPARCAVGTRIRVRVAYDIPEGNPFRAYHPLDFDLRPRRGNPIQLATNGCKIEDRSPNGFDVVAQSTDFTLEVVGFDGRRGDLYLKSDVVPEGSPTT